MEESSVSIRYMHVVDCNSSSRVSHEVEDQLYEGKFYTFNSIHEGVSLTVRYDVSNPRKITLKLGESISIG